MYAVEAAHDIAHAVNSFKIIVLIAYFVCVVDLVYRYRNEFFTIFYFFLELNVINQLSLELKLLGEGKKYGFVSHIHAPFRKNPLGFIKVVISC